MLTTDKSLLKAAELLGHGSYIERTLGDFWSFVCNIKDECVLDSELQTELMYCRIRYLAKYPKKPERQIRFLADLFLSYAYERSEEAAKARRQLTLDAIELDMGYGCEDQ